VPAVESEIFQGLFDHGAGTGDDGQTRVLKFRMLRRKGADFILLPLDNGMAVKALTLYAPQNLTARIAVSMLRLFLRLGLPVPLVPVELQVKSSSPLIEFFTDALNLTGLGATDFAIIAGNPKDAARRYVFLLFDTLHRPALVVKVGLGVEGAATVANEFRFLSGCASDDGVIPEPMGVREGEELAAFALKYQPGWAPPIYEAERLRSCLGKWVHTDCRQPVCELPIWKRLVDTCAAMDGFTELASVVGAAQVSPVIYHGDFAPWNIKVRPDDGSWVVLDWERGEQQGIPGWDWFHYVVQTGVLVEKLDEKNLRARLLHIMESSEFVAYAAQTGIAPIKRELLMLYLLHSMHVLDQAIGSDCLQRLYTHLLEERSTGIDRSRVDSHTFWAARDQGQPWLKMQMIQRPGSWLARFGYSHRISAIVFTSLAFLIAWLGSFAVLKSGFGNVITGLALAPVLIFSSALVAGERILARVTGSSTTLGLVIDRLLGLGVFAVAVSSMAWWSGDGQSHWLPDSWRPAVLTGVLALATAFYSIRCIGDLKCRSGQPAPWSPGILLPILKHSTDGAVRVLLMTGSWALGGFWDFLAGYALVLVPAIIVAAAQLSPARKVTGRAKKFILSTGRSMSRTLRRLLFLKMFLLRKCFGEGRRWMRPGIERIPVPKIIDVVYLWKDESDAGWVERREIFLESIGKGSGYNRINRGSRATKTSLDRLKYSMRSVDKHFKPLGRIFLVTDGQRPPWLKIDDPRVVVVDQNEIFSRSEYLPSYNSQAIESHFHLIPGLSEFFVYFNDDFCLNAPAKASDFYNEDGFVRVRLGRSVSARGVPTVDEEGDTSAQKNANLVLDRFFKKETRLTVMHRPYSHRKSLMARAAEKFPEEFHLTRRSHFRSIEMFALHSYLIPYWAYYIGEAELVSPQLFRKDMFYWSNSPRHNREVANRIRETNPVSFCIQADLSVPILEESVVAYRGVMDSLFPDKSSFEK
jgi:hypothetical protein